MAPYKKGKGYVYWNTIWLCRTKILTFSNSETNLSDISWMLEANWLMNIVEKKEKVSLFWGGLNPVWRSFMQLLLKFAAFLFFTVFKICVDWIFSNCFIFDPTFSLVFYFGEEILKLLCILSAFFFDRTLGWSFALLSFWPGTCKMRQALRFWQLIQVQSNLTHSLKFH